MLLYSWRPGAQSRLSTEVLSYGTIPQNMTADHSEVTHLNATVALWKQDGLRGRETWLKHCALPPSPLGIPGWCLDLSEPQFLPLGCRSNRAACNRVVVWAVEVTAVKKAPGNLRQTASS